MSSCKYTAARGGLSSWAQTTPSQRCACRSFGLEVFLLQQLSARWRVQVNTASFLSSLAIMLPAFRQVLPRFRWPTAQRWRSVLTGGPCVQVDLVPQAKELGLDRLAGWIQVRL